MDQAVLDPCKRRYKRKLPTHIILNNNLADKSIPEILKAITIQDVVYWIAAAWKEASIDSLNKAWRNLLPGFDADDCVSDVPTDSPINNVVQTAAPLGKDTQDAVAEWMEADINDPGYQILNDHEIAVEMMECEEDHHEESSDEEAATSPSVTDSEAFDALDITLRWLEQTNADATHLLLV